MSAGDQRGGFLTGATDVSNLNKHNLGSVEPVVTPLPLQASPVGEIHVLANGTANLRLNIVFQRPLIECWQTCRLIVYSLY
jgi:hypothetical protein